MPLEKGRGRAKFSHNVATEMRAGAPQNQAVAIAYREAGEKRADCVIATQTENDEAAMRRLNETRELHSSMCRPNLHDHLHRR